MQEVYCEEGRGLSRTRPGEPQAVLQTDKVLANPLWTSEECSFRGCRLIAFLAGEQQALSWREIG